MSEAKAQSLPVSVIGAGCAGLSLAARAADLPNHDISLVAPKTDMAEDHIWGFWAMPWLNMATSVARAKWKQWRIISYDRDILHRSDKHPYCAINRHTWLRKCWDRASANGVRFDEKRAPELPFEQILDSRPPPVPDGMMLQHFLGWEVVAPAGSFDEKTAILMDFRCDQTRGIHFIYHLPFSNCQALVESTIFSPELLPSNYYESAINSYLKTTCQLQSFELRRQESGVIPLGVLGRHDPRLAGIGANGGAIRPSSGYAFSFIQKQIAHAVTNAVAGKPLPVGVPHSAFELWMDRIFLGVLRRRPDLAPHIFTMMAASLTGDEFASFLSGEADFKVWSKVIAAMPKLPFLIGLMCPEPNAIVR